MLSFIQSIGESIGVFVQFVSSFVTGIISVFALIGQSWAFLTTAWGVMPSVLLVFITAGLAIVILFQFIGR